MFYRESERDQVSRDRDRRDPPRSSRDDGRSRDYGRMSRLVTFD